MKTLKDHVIIYDDECPMCDLYTCAFVKTKMLDKNGREAYSWIPSTLSKHVDKERARNEIALVNPKTGEVRYGIDSLFFVIAHRFPVLRFLFEWRPFRFVMKHVYSFISYNRRVIIPAEKFEAKNSCTPDLKADYRIAFLVFAWLVVSFILHAYSNLILPLIRESGFTRELLVCGGQMLFQGIVILFINKDKLLHYLGNLMAISLGGGLLLLPAIMISYTGLITTPYFYAGWFLITAGLMFFEHIRRTRILALHWSLSASWVLYRLMLLAAFI
jgi:hypothetical protein